MSEHVEQIVCKKVFVLASTPEHYFAKAKRCIEDQNGYCVAGIAADALNGTILHKPTGWFAWMTRESWKDAWKGKLCMAIETIRRQTPDAVLILIAIEGGRACEWEREQLRAG